MGTAGAKALLILNPTAGTRSKHGVSEYVTQRLGTSGIAVRTMITSGQGDACLFAHRAAADGVDIVIAAGGDGTVNEAASGLIHTSTALGIIPLGSGNGLARSLSIPADLRFATTVIETGHLRTCDCGIVNGKDFFCTFGVGFDAEISQKFALEKRRGRSSYIKNILLEVLKYNPQSYGLAIDGNTLVEKALLIAVCNAHQYGNNAYIAPHAEIDDGLLDVTVIHEGTLVENAMIGIDLFTGYLNRNTLIQCFRGRQVTISRLKEGAVHIDGEPMLMGSKLEISCSPGALRIITPAKTRKFRPVISPIVSFLSDLRYDLRATLKIQ